MNGWQRIGVVLSILWLLSVTGYAAYERSLLPIRIFGQETEDPGIDWHFAQRLLFIDIDTRSAGNVIAQVERYRQAKTDEERKAIQANVNSALEPVYETSLKDIFWLCLLAPIAGLWILSYVAVFIARWVISGFSDTHK